MFKIEKKSESRVDLELHGKLSKDEMTLALDELEAASQQVQDGQMLYRIHRFDLPSLGAVGVELRRMPKLLKLMRQYKRVAVMAETEWLKKVGELEGALIPGLEVKGFALDDLVAAEAWLNEN